MQKTSYIYKTIAAIMVVIFSYTSIALSSPACYSIKVPEKYGKVTARYKAPSTHSPLSKGAPEKAGDVNDENNPLAPFHKGDFEYLRPSVGQDVPNPPQDAKRITTAGQACSSTGNDRTVILIQDAHSLFEAQQNISNIILSLNQSLPSQEQPLLVGVEGAVGPVSIEAFRSYPIEKARNVAAYEYMKSGVFTGSEYAAIIAEKAFDFYGIENRDLFTKNFKIFNMIVSQRNETSHFLDTMKVALEHLKNTVFNAKLKTFDALLMQYEAHATEPDSFILGLYSAAKECAIDISAYPQVLAFEKYVMASAQCDIPQSRLQQKALEELLVEKGIIKKEFLSRDDIDEAACFLLNKARESHIPLGPYGDFSRWCDARLMYESLDMNAFSKECRILSYEICRAYAISDEERTLIQHAEMVSLLERMLVLEADRDEVTRVENARDDWNVMDLVHSIKLLCMKYSLSCELNDERVRVIPELFSTALIFYRGAKERDRAMVDNLLNFMDEQKQHVAVLLAGGFHTSGIAELLKARGVSYLTVMPHLTGAQPDLPYMAKMTGNLVPLNPILTSNIQALSTFVMDPNKSAFLDGFDRSAFIEVVKLIVDDTLSVDAVYEQLKAQHRLKTNADENDIKILIQDIKAAWKKQIAQWTTKEYETALSEIEGANEFYSNLCAQIDKLYSDPIQEALNAQDERTLYTHIARTMCGPNKTALDVGLGANLNAVLGLQAGGIEHIVAMDSVYITENERIINEQIKSGHGDATSLTAHVERASAGMVVFNNSMYYIIKNASQSAYGVELQQRGEGELVNPFYYVEVLEKVISEARDVLDDEGVLVIKDLASVFEGSQLALYSNKLNQTIESFGFTIIKEYVDSANSKRLLIAKKANAVKKQSDALEKEKCFYVECSNQIGKKMSVRDLYEKDSEMFASFKDNENGRMMRAPLALEKKNYINKRYPFDHALKRLRAMIVQSAENDPESKKALRLIELFIAYVRQVNDADLPELYVFDGTPRIKDLFGFGFSNDQYGLVALDRKIYNKGIESDIALFHEFAHFLTQHTVLYQGYPRKALSLRHAVRNGQHIVECSMSIPDENQSMQIQHVLLSDETLSFIDEEVKKQERERKKEKHHKDREGKEEHVPPMWTGWELDVHYILRVLQNQMFRNVSTGDANIDAALTKLIRDLLEERYMRGLEDFQKRVGAVLSYLQVKKPRKPTAPSSKVQKKWEKSLWVVLYKGLRAKAMEVHNEIMSIKAKRLSVPKMEGKHVSIITKTDLLQNGIEFCEPDGYRIKDVVKVCKDVRWKNIKWLLTKQVRLSKSRDNGKRTIRKVNAIEAQFDAMLGALEKQGTTGNDIVDVLLELKKPKRTYGLDKSIAERTAYSAGLDESQNYAKNIMVQTQLSLIAGPAATGKTETIVAAVKELLNNPKNTKPIILFSPQHKSTDDITKRLFVDPMGIPVSRLGNNPEDFDPDVLQSCVVEWEKGEGRRNFNQRFPVFNTQGKKTNRCVYTATHLGGAFDIQKAMQDKAFMNRIKGATIIVDEAALINYPEFMAMVYIMQPGALHMIGDHQQFKPYTLFAEYGKDLYSGSSISSDEILRMAKSYDKSLFEELLDRPLYKASLTTNYRNPEEIVRLINYFYRGITLKSASAVKNETGASLRTIDTSDLQAYEEEMYIADTNGKKRKSVCNRWEAKEIMKHVHEYLNTEGEDGKAYGASDITIMTPYNGQRAVIQKLIEHDKVLTRAQKDILKIQCITSRKMQGGENKVILLSLVKSKKPLQSARKDKKTIKSFAQMLDTEAPIVADKGLLLVSLSRAKESMVVVGNQRTLSDLVYNNPDPLTQGMYAHLFTFLEKNKKAEKRPRGRPRKNPLSEDKKHKPMESLPLKNGGEMAWRGMPLAHDVSEKEKGESGKGRNSGRVILSSGEESQPTRDSSVAMLPQNDGNVIRIINQLKSEPETDVIEVEGSTFYIDKDLMACAPLMGMNAAQFTEKLEAFLKERIEKLPSENREKLREEIALVMLSDSHHLFEDHVQNGLIGVNWQLFLGAQYVGEGLRALPGQENVSHYGRAQWPAPTPNALSSDLLWQLLQMGINHELKHEAGVEKTETEYLEEDKAYILSKESGLGYDELVMINEWVSNICRTDRLFDPVIRAKCNDIITDEVSHFMDLLRMEGSEEKWDEKELRKGVVLVLNVWDFIRAHEQLWIQSGIIFSLVLILPFLAFKLSSIYFTTIAILGELYGFYEIVTGVPALVKFYEQFKNNALYGNVWNNHVVLYKKALGSSDTLRMSLLHELWHKTHPPLPANRGVLSKEYFVSFVEAVRGMQLNRNREMLTMRSKNGEQRPLTMSDIRNMISEAVKLPGGLDRYLFQRSLLSCPVVGKERQAEEPQFCYMYGKLLCISTIALLEDAGMKNDDVYINAYRVAIMMQKGMSLDDAIYRVVEDHTKNIPRSDDTQLSSNPEVLNRITLPQEGQAKNPKVRMKRAVDANAYTILITPKMQERAEFQQVRKVLSLMKFTCIDLKRIEDIKQYDKNTHSVLALESEETQEAAAIEKAHSGYIVIGFDPSNRAACLELPWYLVAVMENPLLVKMNPQFMTNGEFTFIHVDGHIVKAIENEEKVAKTVLRAA